MRRRLVLTGAVFAMLTLVAIGLRGTTPGSSQPIGHEDPATASPDAQPGAVFEYFLAALSRLNTRNYQDARQLFGRLQGASLPPDVQSVLSDLNGVLGKEVSLLEVVDRGIRDITALRQAGRTAEAQRLLAQLDLQVRRADVLFSELSAGVQDLHTRTQGALATNPLQRAAFDDFQRAAARVKGFLLVYRATAKNAASLAAVGQLLPYETVLELHAPETSYPGRLVDVSGRMRERAPSSSGRRISLELDGRVVAERSGNAVHVQFAMPDDMVPGPHRLDAYVRAQGRYLPATWSKTIQVLRLIPRITVATPAWLTVPGRFGVTGAVSSPLGPLQHASVRVSVGGHEYAQETSKSGSFHVSGRLPVALGLGGPEAISIVVVPREPWFASITQTHRLITVNVVSLGALVAVFLAGLAVVFTRVGKHVPVAVLPEAPAATAVGSAQIRALAAAAQGHGPFAAELIAIYRQVMNRLETASGIHAELTTTMREFVHLLPVPAQQDPLWRLTELAELALYSPHPITAALVEQARTLDTQLEGGARSG